MGERRLAVLWGDQHIELGEIAAEPLPPRAAIALSRGRFPKDYHAVDPNEDAVLAASGPAGWLLAVVDGHNGLDAARAALDAVAGHAEALLADPALQPEAAIEGLFDRARAAVAERLRQAEPSRRGSRTALTIALLTDGSLHAASLGDTVAARIGPRWVAEVGGGRPFLGPSTPTPPVGSVLLGRQDAALVASDGLIDYLGDSCHERLLAAGRASDPLQAVQRLVLAAFAGGAGDNVAVGLFT